MLGKQITSKVLDDENVNTPKQSHESGWKKDVPALPWLNNITVRL